MRLTALRTVRTQAGVCNILRSTIASDRADESGSDGDLRRAKSVADDLDPPCVGGWSAGRAKSVASMLKHTGVN